MEQIPPLANPVHPIFNGRPRGARVARVEIRRISRGKKKNIKKINKKSEKEMSISLEKVYAVDIRPKSMCVS